MTKLQVSTVYISAATNRFNRAAHISPDSTTVTFGCGRLVALWRIDVKLALFLRTLTNHTFPQDPDDHGVYEILLGHEGTVTCVQFLHNAFFFSADEKGVVRAWRKGESEVRVYYRTSPSTNRRMSVKVGTRFGHSSPPAVHLRAHFI